MNWIERYERNQDICARWAARETLKSIGRRYDLSEEAVRAIVDVARDAGIVQRDPRPRYDIPPVDPEREAEILNLYWEQGWTLREIGDRFGLTRQRIHQIIYRASQRSARRQEPA